jgi:putative transposase
VKLPRATRPNAFNAWKKSAAAGRVFVVDAAGSAEVVATGLAWRNQVHPLVFEEAAVDLGRGLAAFSASRRGERPGRRVGFTTGSHWKTSTSPA